MKHTGSCFCGAVEVQVTGSPEGMGYCHCRSCRSWSGGPVNAFSLWPPEAVEVLKGAENIATYHKTDLSHRQFCKFCGGHLTSKIHGVWRAWRKLLSWLRIWVLTPICASSARPHPP